VCWLCCAAGHFVHAYLQSGCVQASCWAALMALVLLVDIYHRQRSLQDSSGSSSLQATHVGRLRSTRAMPTVLAARLLHNSLTCRQAGRQAGKGTVCAHIHEDRLTCNWLSRLCSSTRVALLHIQLHAYDATEQPRWQATTAAYACTTHMHLLKARLRCLEKMRFNLSHPWLRLYLRSFYQDSAWLLY
jgi:hypothetical protein